MGLKPGYQHTVIADDRTWITNKAAQIYRVNSGQAKPL